VEIDRPKRAMDEGRSSHKVTGEAQPPGNLISLGSEQRRYKRVQNYKETGAQNMVPRNVVPRVGVAHGPWSTVATD